MTWHQPQKPGPGQELPARDSHMHWKQTLEPEGLGSIQSVPLSATVPVSASVALGKLLTFSVSQFPLL